MPGRDGTGPMGRGAMSGRGFGACTGAKNVRGGTGLGQGLGRGFRRGIGRNFITDTSVSKTQKELMEEPKGTT